MLTLQDLQFHPAWNEKRKTSDDFVLESDLSEYSGSLLAALAHEYLLFSNGRTDDMAFFRAIQCLEAAAEKGVDHAREQLLGLQEALATA